MTAPGPTPPDHDVLAGLPRTRPQRRSAKRGPAPAKDAAAAPHAKDAAAPKAAAKPRAKAARTAAKPAPARARAAPAGRAKAGAARAKAGAAPSSPPAAGYATPGASPGGGNSQALLAQATRTAGEIAKLGEQTVRAVLGRLGR